MMCDEIAPLSTLDVVEAILRREPGYGRVVARLRRLRDECDARVVLRRDDHPEAIREAFDQIGGLVSMALERLEGEHEEKEDSR